MCRKPLRGCLGFALAALLTSPHTASSSSSDLPEGQGTAARFPTVLRLATSTDGRDYRDTNRVLCPNARAPAIARLPDRTLVLVFDLLADDQHPDQSTMVATISSDEGRTWSSPQTVGLRDDRGRLVRANRGALVPADSDGLRLFFVTADPTSNHPEEENASAWMIRSACTPDGRRFQLDSGPPVKLGRPTSPRLLGTEIGGRIHLFAADESADESAADQQDASSQESILRHWVARDGRRLVPAAPLRWPVVFHGGCLETTERGLRATVGTDAGLCTLTSRNGRRWERETGRSLPKGQDPAVIRLRDGSYLMVYAAQADPADRSAPPLLAVPSGWYSADETADADEEATSPPLGELPKSLPGETAEGLPSNADPGADESLLAGEPDEYAGDEPTDAGDAAEFLAAAGLSWESSASANEDPVGPAELDAGPPLPDFETPVDYVDWFKRELVAPAGDDNAFDAYAAFMPCLPGDPPTEDVWPPLIDMFNSGRHTGPPAPWDPAEHADWENTHWAAQSLLTQFRDATRHEQYAPPPLFAEASPSEGSDHRYLMDLLLPSLSQHLALVRATLADAWRTENGRVPAARMTEAMETCLRNAQHLGAGPTTIERLVGLAAAKTAEENALWALHHGVFQTTAELESASNVLRNHDRAPADPASVVRGEQAYALDTLQALFSPLQPEGPPQLNETRARQILPATDDSDTVSLFAQLGQTDRDELLATRDALDETYQRFAEQFRIGYPNVRADDVLRTRQDVAARYPLSQSVVPELERVYAKYTQGETRRRATQLTFAVHLYKARTGQWPQSLDDLPPDYGADLRTDPYTGGNFGYRVTENGPAIYSLSENGLDDGGAHPANRGDGPADSDDLVFWPPQPPPTQ